MVEVFRAALPHKQAQWDERISGKDTLTLEDRLAGQRCAAYSFSRSRYPIQLRIPPSTRMITAPIIGPDLLAKMVSPTPYILFGNKRLRAPRTIASQPRIVMITRQSETQRLCTFTIARPARSANMPKISVAD